MQKNKRLWVLAVIMIVAIVVNQIKEEKKMAGCTSGNCVDFGNQQGIITMFYGTNENDEWKPFATNSAYQGYTRDVGTKYIRTWLSAQSYRESTFPLNQDGSYNWANVDEFVSAVKSTGAIPFIVFAHGDRCGGSGEVPSPFDFSNCAGHGVPPPSNFDAFATYAKTVVQHFIAVYGLSEVNTWYFEIMNEPYNIGIWNNYQDYYILFNKAYNSIKSAAPNAKVGGFAENGIAEFLVNSDPDFIDFHLYPENYGYGCDWVATAAQADDCDQEIMDAVKYIMYDNTINKKGQMGSIELISGEYHISTGNPVDVERPFIGSWLVSAFINQIKSQSVNMELTYTGTCGYSTFNDGCMGLWKTPENRLLSAYYAKKRFTELNPTGSKIYSGISSSNFDIFAVESNGKKYISIVHKQNLNQQLNLEILNSQATKIKDADTAQEISLTSNIAQISFTPYQTRFFEVIAESDIYDVNNDGQHNCIDFFIVSDCSSGKLSGSACTSTDLNGDGQTDILDLILYRNTGYCASSSMEYFNLLKARYLLGTDSLVTFITNANGWVG